MKARLLELIDPHRPLAKAAVELDWTSVVVLFPEAALDGYDAARTWIFASILILGEISGLSEGEVLSRWPENPYWQFFSGFAQFQWKAPVTQTECLAFRRYVDAPRAARLSSIAQSILQAKPVESNALETVVTEPVSSVDDALALRRVHFLQPQPPQPYKAPPRAGFQTGIKQAYARSSAPNVPEAGNTPVSGATDQNASAVSQDITASTRDASLETTTSTVPAAPLAEEPVPQIPEKPVVPLFAQTYTTLVKKAVPLRVTSSPTMMDGIAAPEATPSLSKTAAPESLPNPATARTGSPTIPAQFAPAFREVDTAAQTLTRATAPAGSPQFDTTAPSMRRAVPDEPVTMEVVVTGQGPLRYQWETFDDLTGTATPIEGCNEPSLTVALEAGDTMLAFQCRVSNAPCPQGMLSRTFFLKKAAPPNSFGEKILSSAGAARPGESAPAPTVTSRR